MINDEQEAMDAISRTQTDNHYFRKITLLVTVHVSDAFKSSKWEFFRDRLPKRSNKLRSPKAPNLDDANLFKRYTVSF